MEMPGPFGQRRPSAIGALLMALAIALSACGAGATATPSPSPSPSRSSSPSPSPSPSLSPAASVAADPAADVRITAPYALDPLPDAIQSSLEAAIRQPVSQYGGMFSVGARQVSKGGQAEGFLTVMGLAPVIADDATAMEQILAGISAGTTPTQKTIGGVTVTLVEKSGSQVATFKLGSTLYFVFAATPATATAISTSLIAANA
jgi:hypothetical protein